MAVPSLSPKSPPSPEEAAERLIRDYCRWHVAPIITETRTFDGPGTRSLFLPTKRLVEVESVTVDGGPLTPEDYRFSADGWLTRVGALWPHRERSVTVEFRHGFDPSEAIGEVVAQIVNRAKISPAGNVASQAAGTQRVTFVTNGGEVTRYGLMGSEKEALAPYRLHGVV
jgi:hypothetical protein